MANKDEPGLTPIGHQVSRIASSLRPEAGTSDASVTKPSGSGTTTSATGPWRVTGPRSGGSGSSGLTASSSPARAALINPRKSMPRSIATSLSALVADDGSVTEHGYDERVTGFVVTKPLEPQARLEGIRILRA